MDSSAWIALIAAAWTTIWISAIAIVLGVSMGLLVAILRVARIPFVSHILGIYVSLVRATPMVTLVLLLFVAAPSYGFEISSQAVAIMAMTINTTAFNAEIWREALGGFSKEQREAALAAGMTSGLMLRRIVLPQILITSLPGLVNEMTSLMKSSPAVAVIGIVDLTRVTNRIAAVTYDPLPSILAAGGMYLLIIGLLVSLQRFVESRARHLVRYV